jgi:glycosyltransferase involved in cell wall biosynthesis
LSELISGPSVSVVIPTYNYGRFIAEAIESALGQTLTALEIVVVDDGSTDDTETVLGQFGDRIRQIRQSNKGVSAARNRGIEETKGDLIAFLDADDTWEPTKLETQSKRFAADAEVGLVHCGMREFDSETGETLDMHLDGGELDVAENLLMWNGPVVVGPGCTIMVSRKAFDEVGGFDPRLKCGEDWDLCYRIARRYKVGFVPEPLVNYRIHGAAAHHNVENMELGMGMFYEKAFATDDPEVQKLKRRAYGNYHRVIAGSYLHAGRWGKFVEHSAKSLLNRPSNIGYFLAYPLRRLR